jgi:hypothetical protein
MNVYRGAVSQWGASKAFELLLQAVLISPHFLYQLETSVPSDGEEIAALDGYELAARLSFFLWQSVPDAELLDAAEAGELDTREGITKQAQRLLGDERARDTVDSFFGQWLGIAHLDDHVKDESLFPNWAGGLAASMTRETLTFANHVVREGGSLETLLTATYTFADPELAAFYGAEPNGDFGRVELDGSERAGILTHASVLANLAHASEASWVHRGKFVRDNLLCDPLPAPPKNINQADGNDPGRLDDANCKGCHVKMDPIGLGFEQYDAIGNFVSSVDADAVELIEAGELSGSYDSPVDMVNALADTDVVRRCVAKHVFRYAARREETPDDDCSLDAVDVQFTESDLQLSQLLIALTTSDAFRFRRAAK